MNIETIIQGGAVGIALVCLVIIYKLAGNHINHNTRMLQKMIDKLDELIVVVKNQR